MDNILKFHSELAQWVEHELESSPNGLTHNGVDISRAIFNFLWYENLSLRQEYMAYNQEAHPTPFFATRHITIAAEAPDIAKEISSDLSNHPWREILARFKGCTLVFGDSDRRLRYLAPIINQLDSPTIILTRGA